MAILVQKRPIQRDQRGGKASETDDAVLVERAQRDPAAFVDLYRRYVNSV